MSAWYRKWHKHSRCSFYHLIFLLLVVGLSGIFVTRVYGQATTEQGEISLETPVAPSVLKIKIPRELRQLDRVPPEEIKAAKERIKNHYIITFKDDTVDDIDSETDTKVKKHRLKLKHRYKYALKGLAAEVPPEELEALKQDPNIASVEPDFIATGDAQMLPSGVDRIDADKNTTAKIDGVDERVDADIAILDSGIDNTHPDLNVVEAVNFTTYGVGDVYGHGTHVAGIAAALDNSVGVVGVAPGARLHSVKVLGDNNYAYGADMIAGVDWVTQHADAIEVANMSLGGVGLFPSLQYAIKSAVAKGVVFVVAAGNNSADVYGADGVFGTNDDYFPASFPEAITVSAMDPTTNLFASFSNYSRSVISGNPVNSPGKAIDLIAPGVSAYSTLKGGGYGNKSGTSMATPHVTGLAALFIAKNGRAYEVLGVKKIRQALIDTAEAQSRWGVVNTQDKDANPEPLADAETVPTVVMPPPPVDTFNNMYVSAVTWQETVKKNGSLTLKATVTIRRDSNNNHLADSGDAVVSQATAGVKLTAAGADGTFGTSDDVAWTGSDVTGRGGKAVFSWVNAPRGQVKAEVTDLTHVTYTWNKNFGQSNPALYTTTK